MWRSASQTNMNTIKGLLWFVSHALFACCFLQNSKTLINAFFTLLHSDITPFLMFLRRLHRGQGERDEQRRGGAGRGGQVSCDWSTPGHVTSWSPLIGQLSPPSYHQYSPGLGYTVDTMNTTAGQQQSSAQYKHCAPCILFTIYTIVWKADGAFAVFQVIWRLFIDD